MNEEHVLYAVCFAINVVQLHYVMRMKDMSCMRCVLLQHEILYLLLREKTKTQEFPVCDLTTRWDCLSYVASNCVFICFSSELEIFGK